MCSDHHSNVTCVACKTIVAVTVLATYTCYTEHAFMYIYMCIICEKRVLYMDPIFQTLKTCNLFFDKTIKFKFDHHVT